MVGQAGRPRQDGQEVPQVEVLEEEEEERERERERNWWGHHFFETTTEQYEESVRRARALVTTPRVPPPGANMNFWSPHPYLQVSASETEHPDEVDPRCLEEIVQARLRPRVYEADPPREMAGAS